MQDENQFNATRSLYVDRPYLILPVRFDASLVLMRISDNGVRKRRFGIKLAGGSPDYHVFACLREFMGKTIEVECEGEADGPLDSLTLSDDPVQADDLYSERYRQQYHFSSRRGFINDPNGLVYYEGEYHLYYQHQPFGTDIGFDLKHWGHAVSGDLVRWTELDTAVYPDELGSIFSGSTVVDWDNSSGFQSGSVPPLVAMYTVDGRNADEKLPLVQCIASSNDRGRSWQKHQENPALDHIVGLNRDPRVFRHGPSNEWRMVMYLDGDTYAVFGSTDLKRWVKLSEIILPESQDCPDLFELPVDGNPGERKWVFWTANTRYLLGSFDGRTFTPESEPLRYQPAGTAYAAQTWSDMPSDDPRVVQISWFLTETPGMPFTHCMTVPCALSLTTTPKGVRLCAKPVRELESLRKDRRNWTSLILDPGECPEFDTRKRESPARFGDWVRYPLGKVGDCIDMECVIEIGTAEIAGISIRGIMVLYHRGNATLSIDTGIFSQRRSTSVPMELEDGAISLRILLDRVSIEVLSSDGLVSCPAAMLPVDDNHDLFATAKGGRAVVRSLNCWRMKSIHA